MKADDVTYLRDKIGKIETHLAVISERLKNHVDHTDDIDVRISDIGKQVQFLNRWKWAVAGAVSVISFLAPHIIKR
jgi:hypothetical protein